MASKHNDELSEESRQAIAAAEADANREKVWQNYIAEMDDGTDEFAALFLANPFALPAELAQDSAPKNARSEAQLAVDSVIRDVHAKWLEAGEPRAWPDIVATGTVAGYWVTPKNVDQITKMIKSAIIATPGVSVKWGRTTPRTEDMPQDGRVFVNFTVTTTRKRYSAQAAE